MVPAEKPTEPEKNKYVRWDIPMTTEVDAEIKRMNVEGKTSQEISEELAKRNIFVTWQRVRGRIGFMTRKPKEALQTPKDEGKTPEMQYHTNPNQNRPRQARLLS
jgi:hypothetical protein